MEASRGKVLSGYLRRWRKRRREQTGLLIYSLSLLLFAVWMTAYDLHAGGHWYVIACCGVAHIACCIAAGAMINGSDEQLEELKELIRREQFINNNTA